jgi:hypothetical protein
MRIGKTILMAAFIVGLSQVAWAQLAPGLPAGVKPAMSMKTVEMTAFGVIIIGAGIAGFMIVDRNRTSTSNTSTSTAP